MIAAAAVRLLALPSVFVPYVPVETEIDEGWVTGGPSGWKPSPCPMAIVFACGVCARVCGVGIGPCADCIV